MTQQKSFLKTNYKHRLSYGGTLRQKRQGRRARPLSCKDPIHVVFKINHSQLKQLSLRSHQTFKVVQPIINRYAKKFFIKIEQATIQNDHIHLLIRTSRRSLFQYFFRVVAGQIAQQLQTNGLLDRKKASAVTDTPKTRVKLWKHRPFTRVVKGYKAYKTVRNYIQLNIKEAEGKIKYNKRRLRGLSSSEWALLWT